jgi:hypothetical protein
MRRQIVFQSFGVVIPMAQRYSVGFVGGTPIQGYRGLSPELVSQPFWSVL